MNQFAELDTHTHIYKINNKKIKRYTSLYFISPINFLVIMVK